MTARGQLDAFGAATATAAYRADPYPYLAQLRRREPVLRLADGTVVLTRYDDVAGILSDRRAGTAPPHGGLDGYGAVSGIQGIAGNDVPRPVSMLDPPMHGRVRGALGQAFGRDAPTVLRPTVAHLVSDMLAKVAERSGQTVDAVTQLALPVPLAAICGSFGIPEEDHADVVRWSRALVRNGDPGSSVTDAQRDAAQHAEREFASYMGRLVVRRRRTPGDDIVSRLVRADVAAAPLDLGELVANAVFLLVNGYHNTVNLIANSLLALLRNPDQLAALRRAPATEVPAAVDELLRYDSPIQSIARVTHRPIDLRGHSLPAGTGIMAMVAAAHRDPEAFAEPDRLMLSRRPARRVLSFGGGHHYCLGAGLARSEAEYILVAVLRRFPELSLAGQPVWAPTFTLRGLESLPVSLGRPAGPRRGAPTSRRRTHAPG